MPQYKTKKVLTRDLKSFAFAAKNVNGIANGSYFLRFV